jgi:hypothetical protein
MSAPADLVLFLAKKIVEDPAAVRVEEIDSTATCSCAARRRGRPRQGDRPAGADGAVAEDLARA